ncbi:hypothetical protein LIER_21872 [Lithospermum erythrorhizon]|uniref:Uncharacterized protein n=1 Tax=Lithospermum erythrorhizon TaxID=34254 RepID=A0AAV3QXH9_LITER
MFESSSNFDAFVVRPRTEGQEEASISREMQVLQATGPSSAESIIPVVETTVSPPAPVSPDEAERARLHTKVGQGTSSFRLATFQATQDPGFQEKAPQVPLQDSAEEVIPSREKSHMGPMSHHLIQQQTPVVDLDSSTTLSNHQEECDFLPNDTRIPPPVSNQRPLDTTEAPPTVEEPLHQKEGKAIAAVQVPPYDGRYLVPPYRLPNLEVTRETPSNSSRFHFHAVKPLLNKEVATRYAPLKDPFAAFAQTVKHINEALNGAYVLAKRTDWLTHEYRVSKKTIEILRKVIATNNKLFNGAKKDLIAEKEERAKQRAKLSKAASAEAKKGWVAEKAQKENEVALASVAAEAKSACADYARRTVHDFLRNPTYQKKVGRECVAYLTHVFTHRKGEFPDLVRVFEVEQKTYPIWYEGLSLDPPTVDEDEGMDSLGDANV